MRTWEEVVPNQTAQLEIREALEAIKTGMSREYTGHYAWWCATAKNAVRIIEECLNLFNPPAFENCGHALGLWLLHAAPLLPNEREIVRTFLYDHARY